MLYQQSVAASPRNHPCIRRDFVECERGTLTPIKPYDISSQRWALRVRYVGHGQCLVIRLTNGVGSIWDTPIDTVARVEIQLVPDWILTYGIV